MYFSLKSDILAENMMRSSLSELQRDVPFPNFLTICPQTNPSQMVHFKMKKFMSN